MSKYIKTMQRSEKKYCLSKEQYRHFIHEIAHYTTHDHYSTYTISNIYLDTHCYESLSKSMNKPFYKEKLRLRSYDSLSGNNDVFIEIKKKAGGIVYKRRVQMAIDEARDYLMENKLPKNQSQIMNEIDWVKQSQNLEPKIFIAYDRQAFCDNKDASVRITIDENIRWRTIMLEFDEGTNGFKVAKGIAILEIKVTQSMPLWLTNVLDKLKIYPCSFSKYAQCCMDLQKRKEDNRV